MHRNARALATILQLVGFVTLFLVAALIVRTFIIGTGVVDGLSMYPTFADNEHLLIDKVTLLFREPQRSDVVQLIHKPNGSLLVKRIIGLPGETIRIRKNAVYLVSDDGTETKLDEPYIREGVLTRNWDNKPATYGPFAPHEYFVLGDNREHSRGDSRLLGPIPRQWIYGLAYPLMPF